MGDLPRFPKLALRSGAGSGIVAAFPAPCSQTIAPDPRALVPLFRRAPSPCAWSANFTAPNTSVEVVERSVKGNRPTTGQSLGFRLRGISGKPSAQFHALRFAK